MAILITGNFWELDPLRLNFRVISASLYLIALYLSDCWKILRITSLRLNLGVISAVNTVFITQELSDCRKFLRIRPLRLNVRTISAYNYQLNAFPIVYQGDCSIRVFQSLDKHSRPLPGAPRKLGPREKLLPCWWPCW